MSVCQESRINLNCDQITPDIMSLAMYTPPSMTAMKYQRLPYIGRPLQPGERMSVCREMETSVRGYREINKDLTQARRNVNFQENIRRSASIERTAPASFTSLLWEPDQQKEEVLSTIQKWLE